MRARFLLTVLLTLGLAVPGLAEVEGAALGAVSPNAPASEAPGEVQLVIEAPTTGGVVESEMHMAEIRGTALAAGDRASDYDVMIVLDLSQSTRHASGADVDGDGNVGEDPHMGLFAAGEYPDDVYSTDPEDTILHAEVLAGKTLLQNLNPERVRVGLISFSGQVDPKTSRQVSRDQRDAHVEVPLTHRYADVAKALDDIASRAPRGATNFAAGIRLATQELAGFSGSASAAKEDAQKIMLFLTDGIPSFPAGRADVQDPGDIEAAVAAARVARSAGIRINSYALGPDALTKPLAATEIARVTLGTFTPVLEPGNIVSALQSVSFANIEDVGVLNLTTRENAPDVRLNPDGSFTAFVPVKEGRNKVLVNALATDGGEANIELEFDFQVKANLDDRMRQQELARMRRMNDELIRHLEAERIKRERRQKRMERELEIRPVRPPDAE